MGCCSTAAEYGARKPIVDPEQYREGAALGSAPD